MNDDNSSRNGHAVGLLEPLETFNDPTDGNTLIEGTRAHRRIERVPGVMKCHEILFGVFEARRKNNRPSLVYCGDDASAKDVVTSLIRDAGFDPVDTGPLRIARYMERSRC